MKAASVLVCVLAGLLACAAVPAGAAGATDGELARIARERADVEALFVQRRQACQSRFAVTDCVDDAKQLRREALAPLRRQADALDDAQRKQRAEKRLAEIAERTQAEHRQAHEILVRQAPASAAKATPSPVEEAGSAVIRVREEKLRPPPKPPAPRSPRAAPTLEERRAAEASSQARTDARKQAAQAHRDEVDKRNAQREQSGKIAAPLPASAGVP